MLTLEMIRLGIEMLGWSHAQLVEFVRARSGPGGPLRTTAPLSEPLEVELAAEIVPGGVRVRTLGSPAIEPAQADDATGNAICMLVARRARTLEAVLTAAVTPRIGRLTGADLAFELNLARSLVERIVRGRRVRVDGEEVPLTSLVDLEGPVVTSRRALSLSMTIEPCMDPLGLGDPARCEWPNNVLSTRAVMYENGRIAREGEPVTVRYLPREMARCERLALAAEALVRGLPIGMRSESDEPFTAYYRVAPPEGMPTTVAVDEAFVRELFGGTISPWDPVVIEPFDESCSLFRDLADSGADESTSERWRALARFFRETPDLVPPAYLVSIGFFEYAPAEPLPEAQRPAGFASRGSRLPRLIFAHTEAGSVVGLLGHVVWT